MSEIPKKDSKAKKENKKRILLIILFMIFAIGAGSIFVAFHLNRREANLAAGQSPVNLLPPGFAQDGPLPGMSADEIRKQMQIMADSAYFAFKINARPIFQTGAAQGNLQIENPSYNVYPMVVQIFLDDTEEKIFDSGGILPNQHIENASLARALSAGEYKATAYMNAYDPDSRTWLGKQAAALVITVQA